MELNKETALRLWTQQFGKAAKTTDFAGREIAKAGYNNRNSRFCWNVDHILPQSRGGKTADYNLICCHMETNDEKADSFPCFTANHKHFQIERRQNHYEIIPIIDSQDEDADGDSVNFYDAAQGMKCWKRCKHHPQETFTGYVKIRLDISKDDPFILCFRNFLEEFFDSSEILMDHSGGYCDGFYSLNAPPCKFTVLGFDLSTQEDMEDLLDQCVAFNTYADLFREKYHHAIKIFCGAKCYVSETDSALKMKGDIIDYFPYLIENLGISELIRLNTSAGDKIPKEYGKDSYSYNIVFTKLQKDLKKYL